MVNVNNWGYLERRTNRYKCEFKRDWWLVKYKFEKRAVIQRGIISLGLIYFPEKYVGKRIRLKVEVIEDENI